MPATNQYTPAPSSKYVQGVENAGKVLKVNSSGVVEPAEDSLPTVTSSDNGKVLRVVDGAWVASALPSASGVSF